MQPLLRRSLFSEKRIVFTGYIMICDWLCGILYTYIMYVLLMLEVKHNFLFYVYCLELFNGPWFHVNQRFCYIHVFLVSKLLILQSTTYFERNF